MPPPTVSVLMPAYNARRYVARAVESILAQTFADFELLVIDDGSTDNTRQILEPWRPATAGSASSAGRTPASWRR